MQVGQLNFTAHDILNVWSLEDAIPKEDACGIYVYEFTNGQLYVGKSKDVRKRHIEHMHEYSKDNYQLLPQRMLWAPFYGSYKELGDLEKATIGWFNDHEYSLTNVKDSDYPRGKFTVTIKTGENWGVPIPWKRSEIPSSTREFSFEQSPDKEKRFERLAKRDDYAQIMRILSLYINKLIPAPADSVGSLWTITVYPESSGVKRLICITCDTVETLVIFNDRSKSMYQAEELGFINVKPYDTNLWINWDSFESGLYPGLPGCVQLNFYTLDELEKLLNDETLLDAAYRAVAELLRQGPTPNTRYNNPYIMKELLDAKPQPIELEPLEYPVFEADEVHREVIARNPGKIRHPPQQTAILLD